MNNAKIFLLSFLISLATLSCYGNDSEKTMLIFTARWCKYCTFAKNDIRNHDIISEKIKEYTIIEVDYDKDKDIAKGHNVNTLPTFIIFQDGKEVRRMSGYGGSNKLIDFLQ